MKPLAILKEYFGFRAEEHRAMNPQMPETRLTGMADFATEIKALSPEEKEELVQGAAKELGVEVTQS